MKGKPQANIERENHISVPLWAGTGLLAIACWTLVLAGCSLPGMSFHGAHKTNTHRQQGYTVQPITPSLLRKQAENSAKAEVGETNPQLEQAISSYTYRIQPQDVIGVTRIEF